MKIDIITALPELLTSYLNNSILKIGSEKGLLKIGIHDLRNWTNDKHRTVDDSPYGGGPGMIMKIEPFVKAIRDLKKNDSIVIMPTPSGETYNQKTARQLSYEEHLIIICGHYKGIDGRIENFVDKLISIGDFILTGGELPAAIITDSVCRLIPGVISDIESANSDSFENDLLDCDYFTRPPVFENYAVPEVLISGNHKAINEWRKNDSVEKTKNRRPDLIEIFNKLK
ncbi:MAG: tRNA (guanosine(37)-N1)-methyltransferase TrmD [Candidatus Delongbacteria bacterium]|nr:tRNA (guanosine(37)-N1)-methyltransferase TrmD [Candidatus Delongbacteria bacterium]MCG2760790.1 tRNA (guanosine(37)-N1)-methyltransferase TrmD [Candidatus Delongbacteria bacterium]